jgi:DsbC/DsbD-like thiol-disulfide interchange protein/cytochrome c biogenesis protein CcdA
MEILHPTFMRWVKGIVCLVLLTCAVRVPAQFETFKRNVAHTKARLLLSHETAKPGETITAGIELTMDEGWHTYWQNAGDSGDATKVFWNLPKEFSAGAIQWPVPEKFVDKEVDLTTFVFHNRAVLLVPLKVAADATAGPRELSALVKWLECQTSCVPGSNLVSATLTIGADSKPSANAALIAEAQRKLPSKQLPGTAVAKWDAPAGAPKRPLVIEWSVDSKNVDFFPFTHGDATVSARSDILPGGGKVLLRKTVEKTGGDWPKDIRGLLVRDENGATAGYEVALPIAGLSGGAMMNTSGKSLWLWLIYAFIGGLILNVMPCVLPVIALKILGFVAQSREEPRRVRVLGLLYAIGVVLSFIVLAGVVISAGKAATWGMQFQDRRFLIAITALVTLVALNLFGVFEVTLSGRAMSAAGVAASQHGSAGAFFNGVLAVVLATPCTAPFLGAAVGFALTQSAITILLIFVSVGLGLAFPYVVLSWSPRLMRFMPKPGAWMEKFKNAMGFPMLAAAIWLFTLATPHFGKHAPFWLGIFLLLISIAAWVWGQFIQRRARHQALAVFAILLALGSGAYALTQLNSGEDWPAWSTAAVDKARADGHPVFVDFTAEWCAICKANERSSIQVKSVQQKLKEIGAVTLIGDNTREDPTITAELQKHGRAGVPLVLVYPKDPGKPPIVLPELLTPGIVLKALDEAAK